MKVIPLDDYNQVPRPDIDYLGAVTTNWGIISFRHGWKIIEAWDETDSDQYDRGNVQNDSIHLLQDRNLQCL